MSIIKISEVKNIEKFKQITKFDLNPHYNIFSELDRMTNDIRYMMEENKSPNIYVKPLTGQLHSHTYHFTMDETFELEDSGYNW